MYVDVYTHIYICTYVHISTHTSGPCPAAPWQAAAVAAVALGAPAERSPGPCRGRGAGGSFVLLEP
eukprot:6902600-Lingulodinium_polyedra.AAC.1